MAVIVVADECCCACSNPWTLGSGGTGTPSLRPRPCRHRHQAEVSSHTITYLQVLPACVCHAMSVVSHFLVSRRSTTVLIVSSTNSHLRIEFHSYSQLTSNFLSRPPLASWSTLDGPRCWCKETLPGGIARPFSTGGRAWITVRLLHPSTSNAGFRGPGCHFESLPSLVGRIEPQAPYGAYKRGKG